MSKDSSFPWLKWLLILAALAIIAGGVTWFLISRSNAAPQYQTTTVTRGDLTQVVTASGQLDPVLNVQVGSQISGIVRKLNVDFNSTVKSNQVIAEIDPSTYQVNVLKAEADLANAKANLELNQVQARRAEALHTAKLISDSDFDTAVAQLHQADAQVQSDEATLKNAKVQLSYCTIFAPVDGVVISRNVDVGQTVAASFNTPTLFIIANDLSKMQIDALVSEADIGSLSTNQNVNFQVDAYPYRTFRGVVTQIRYGPVTNQNVVNYDCVIEVNNADLKLLPGMTANVSVIVAERPNALRIPNAALRFRPPEALSADTKTNAAPPQTAADGPRAAGGPGAGGGGMDRGAGPRSGGGPGFGPGGFGGGPGGPRGAGMRSGNRPDRAAPRTVYVVDRSKDPDRPTLTPVKIRTGINDGASTEVVDGLKEGDEVVTGLLNPPPDAAPRTSNPFGGGGRRF